MTYTWTWADRCAEAFGFEEFSCHKTPTKVLVAARFTTSKAKIGVILTSHAVPYSGIRTVTDSHSYWVYQ
jgi:hypothetical protein